MGYDVTINLWPAARALVLRLLEEEDSEVAQELRWQINYRLEQMRAETAEKRERDAYNKRANAAHAAASIVAEDFAERHAGSFPGANGINQSVLRWVTDQARQRLLGEEPSAEMRGVRSEWRARVRMGLDALLDDLRTPDGARRAALREAKTLRARAADYRAVPLYENDPQRNERLAKEIDAAAAELERTGVIPGLFGA